MSEDVEFFKNGPVPTVNACNQKDRTPEFIASTNRQNRSAQKVSGSESQECAIPQGEAKLTRVVHRCCVGLVEGPLVRSASSLFTPHGASCCREDCSNRRLLAAAAVAG